MNVKQNKGSRFKNLLSLSAKLVRELGDEPEETKQSPQ